MSLTPQELDAPHTVAPVKYNATEDLWQSKGSFYGQDSPELPYIEYRMKIRGKWSAGILLFRGPEGTRMRSDWGTEMSKGVHGTFLPAPSVISAEQIVPEAVIHLREGDTLVFNGHPLIVEESAGNDAYPQMWTPSQYGAIKAAAVLGALRHTMPSMADRDVISRAMKTLDDTLINPPMDRRG